MLAGTILAFGSARKLCSSNNLTEYSIQLQHITKCAPCQIPGWRDGERVCLTVHLPPPERSGGKERKCGDNHAGDEGTRANLVRLDPSDPRCGDGEQEHGGDSPGQQRA